MANFSFDASSVAPQVTNGVLPAGTYLAHITEFFRKSCDYLQKKRRQTFLF